MGISINFSVDGIPLTVGQIRGGVVPKFENDVLVPTLVADGFLQCALAVGDLQDQLKQQKTS